MGTELIHPVYVSGYESPDSLTDQKAGFMELYRDDPKSRPKTGMKFDTKMPPQWAEGMFLFRDWSLIEQDYAQAAKKMLDMVFGVDGYHVVEDADLDDMHVPHGYLRCLEAAYKSQDQFGYVALPGQLGRRYAHRSPSASWEYDINANLDGESGMGLVEIIQALHNNHHRLSHPEDLWIDSNCRPKKDRNKRYYVGNVEGKIEIGVTYDPESLALHGLATVAFQN